jgi:DNA-binding CsgD family transcriptional regulator
MKITPEQIIEIEKETNNGKTSKEIAKLLGITIGMVEYQRSKYGWKSKYNPNILDKYLEEIKILVEKEYTDREIAEKYNCNDHTVARFRKKHNLQRRNLKLCKEKEITKDILEFLLGSVLGDCSIVLRGQSARISCQHSIKQEAYLLHKAKILESLEPKISYRNNTEYPSVGFQTKGTPSLNYLYNAFYVNEKKVIPFELLENFTEKSLAYLFMDDGFPVKGKNGHICSIGFALCNFSDKDLTKFSNFLKTKFNLDSYISKHYNKKMDKYYSNLLINASCFNHFQNLIKPYIQNWACYKIGDS